MSSCRWQESLTLTSVLATSEIQISKFIPPARSITWLKTDSQELLSANTYLNWPLRRGSTTSTRGIKFKIGQGSA